jgi:hypothetical protein
VHTEGKAVTRLVVLLFASLSLLASVLLLAAGPPQVNDKATWIGVVMAVHMILITRLSLRRPRRLGVSTIGRRLIARTSMLAASALTLYVLARAATSPRPAPIDIAERLTWDAIAGLLVLSSVLILVGFSIGLDQLVPSNDSDRT